MITQSELKTLISYNKSTGIITWINCSFPSLNGNECGGINKDGYRYILLRNKSYLSHRLIFLYVNGEIPSFIDHINHNKLDNRWSNLSSSSPLDNARNKSLYLNNTSGCTGVTWHKQSKKWQVTICGGDEYKYLGIYENKNDAVITRKMAEYQRGFHKNHGETL